MKAGLLTRRFRDLPLAWKILVPYLVLVLIVGAAGGVLVLQSLTTRAQTALDDQLSRRLLDARSALHERELYLLESADYAANIQGVAGSVARADDTAATRLLGSVIGLKTDLSLLILVDRAGRGVAELTKDATGRTSIGTGTLWSDQAVVRAALGLRTSRAVGGILTVGDRRLLAVATPICGVGVGCRPVGVAVAGLELSGVVRAVRPSGTDLALYDSGGVLLGAAGRVPGTPRALSSDGLTRVRHGSGSTETQSLYGPLLLQGQTLGTLAVTVRAAPAFASVRGTSQRLIALLVLAMLGVVGIGALLARSILRQLRPLVATNRRLGAGDLEARVPVGGDDEIGELATGLNQMADQLQAAVTTLSVRAEQNAEEVERLLHERTAFFASLSHEFRTPLAVIRAQADLVLGRSGARDTDNRVSLQIVKDAATEALKLVNEVLELSQADAGSVEVDPITVSMTLALQDLRPTFFGLATAAGLTAVLDVPAGLPTVLADPRRLRQILLNLMDNAVKYTPAGGTVTVTVTAGENLLEVAVSDTGIGIPAGALDTLFAPFARVQGARTQAGQASTGLGLSLCRQLVEAQGGTIWAESDGRGSTFHFTIPTASPVPIPARRKAPDAVPSPH